MLIADTLRRRGLRDNVEVHLFTPEPRPMPVAGPALGDAVRQMPADKSVSFHPLHKLTKVDHAACELAFEEKDSFKYDLLVAIPPHRGPHSETFSPGLASARPRHRRYPGHRRREVK